jgi:hypothetical protein
MTTPTFPLLLATALIPAGYGNTTGERAGSGALMGATTGGLIGWLSGNCRKGALIAAGIAAVGGYLVDQDKKGCIDQRP